MNRPDPHNEKPGPRRASRAAISVVVIILVMVVAIFVLRQFFHAETQQEDPASVDAPDNTAGEGSAPAQ